MSSKNQEDIADHLICYTKPESKSQELIIETFPVKKESSSQSNINFANPSIESYIGHEATKRKLKDSQTSDFISNIIEKNYPKNQHINLNESEEHYYNSNYKEKSSSLQILSKKINKITPPKTQELSLLKRFQQSDRDKFPVSLFKNLRQTNPEHKALAGLKKWTSNINPPEKRPREEANVPKPAKKPKSIKNDQLEIIKNQSKPLFSVDEFIKLQEGIQMEEVQNEIQRREAVALRKKEKEKMEELKKSLLEYTPAKKLELEKINQKKLREKNCGQTSDFFYFLLSLNIFAIKYNGELPMIPNEFSDGQEYIVSFLPAFFEEAKAEIFSALCQQNMSSFSIITTSIHSTKEGFGYLTFKDSHNSEAFSKLAQSDDLILMLPNSGSSFYDPKFEQWEKREDFVLGILEKPGKLNFFLIKVLRDYLSKFSDKITDSSPQSWRVFIIDSCTTMFREFKMIRNAEFCELSDYIFKPSTGILQTKSHKVDLFVASIERNFNDSQVDAIRKTAYLESGILLLQGPPGTGKTHTIKGILSAIIAKSKEIPRILVCAPSNSAVDEIAKRVIQEKLYAGNGRLRDDIRLLRIGIQRRSFFDIRETVKIDSKETPECVKDICLSALVENAMKSSNHIESSMEGTQDVPTDHKTHSDAQGRLFRTKDSNKKTLDLIIDQEIRIINSAHIIFTTLSGAASKEMSKFQHKFDYVIIDEACQSVELSSLIPFKYGAKVIVMIGDPMQLPATTFNYNSNKNLYSRSLFERMQQAGCKVSLLSTQYRMLAEICKFPSLTFYNDRILTCDSLSSRITPAWIKTLGTLFINLTTSQEFSSSKDPSVSNPSEANFIRKLYDSLRHLHGSTLKIGVITPYKKQEILIKNLLSDSYDNQWKIDIEVNTIDGFQGREKDVIVFSAVRSGNNIGFLADVRRMNVAITRAKFALWVIGSRGCLEKNSSWKGFIDYVDSIGKVQNAQDFEECRYLFADHYQVIKENERRCGRGDEKKPEAVGENRRIGNEDAAKRKQTLLIINRGNKD